jgi:hypothetical protein
MAMKAAVREVIAEHAREGRPIYVWRDGRVVEIPARELRKRYLRAGSRQLEFPSPGASWHTFFMVWTGAALTSKKTTAPRWCGACPLQAGEGDADEYA